MPILIVQKAPLRTSAGPFGIVGDDYCFEGLQIIEGNTGP